jgi:glutathione S-transferase
VRWALNEAGLAYEEKLIGPEEQRSHSYRRLQPFGQVPAFEEDGLILFESGAIVMHIAERSEVLMPRDSEGRARTKTWMFAALNSIELPLLNVREVELQQDQEWAKLHRPAVIALAKARLTALSAWLDDRVYLEDRFSAGDLLMTTVLRVLRDHDLLDQLPKLVAYRRRCEARPAFVEALAAQMASFTANARPSEGELRKARPPGGSPTAAPGTGGPNP